MPAFAYDAPGAPATLRVGDVIGAPVVNGTGDAVGTVDDLLVAASAEAPRAVLSVGGFLGIGDRLVSVPYGALSIARTDDGPGIAYEATEGALEALPTFAYANDG